MIICIFKGCSGTRNSVPSGGNFFLDNPIQMKLTVSVRNSEVCPLTMKSYISSYQLMWFSFILVIRVKVKKKLNETRWNQLFIERQSKPFGQMKPKYEVQIQTIWKGEPLIIKAAQNDRDTKVINIRIDSVIHTSFDKCGLNLSTGKKYILSGNILGNKLWRRLVGL